MIDSQSRTKPKINSFEDYQKFKHALRDEVFDNSSIDLFMRCPRKFLYEHEMGLVAGIESEPLTFGSAIHEAFYEYYKGSDIDTCLKAFIKRCRIPGSTIDLELDLSSNSDQQYSIEWGTWLLQRYFERFPIKDEPWEVVRDHEGKPYLEMGFAIDAGDGVFVGKIDQIIRMKDTGDVWIIDHKTTKSVLNDKFGERWNPNNQMTGYLWGVHELLGEMPKGAIINAFRSYQFKRGNIEDIKAKAFMRIESRRHPDEVNDRANQIRHTMKTINWFRKRFDEVKEGDPSVFYMNAPNACQSYWPHTCVFVPVCLCHNEQMRREIIVNNFRRKTWVAYDELKNRKRFEVIKVA